MNVVGGTQEIAEASKPLMDELVGEDLSDFDWILLLNCPCTVMLTLQRVDRID